MASVVAAIALGAATPVENRFVTESFADLFEAREHRLARGERQEPLAVRYRLFVPRDLGPRERCPLLVWLHGAGEGGEENHRNLKYLPLVLKDVEHVEKYRFFILVPQCPSPEIGWTADLRGPLSKPSEAVDMLTATYEILQATMRERPVDADRVYLTGICSGGNACWEMGMRHPELFAAMAPATPGGGDVSRASRLAGIPIWAFQSQYEHPEGAQAMIAAIEAAGGAACLTLARGGHDSWTLAFLRCEVMDWMLAQHRRARLLWTPPGHRAWRWWHIGAVPIGFIALTFVGWRSEQKRRQRRQLAQADAARLEC